MQDKTKPKAPPFQDGPEFTLRSGAGQLRWHDKLKVWRPHMGEDRAAAEGTPVRSVAPGVVVYSGPRTEYGNTIVVRHVYNGRYVHALYAHLNGQDMARRGDKVPAGAMIGRVGNTGISTGPHLHFELIDAGDENEVVRSDGTYVLGTGLDHLRRNPSEFTDWYKLEMPSDIDVVRLKSRSHATSPHSSLNSGTAGPDPKTRVEMPPPEARTKVGPPIAVSDELDVRAPSSDVDLRSPEPQDLFAHRRNISSPASAVPLPPERPFDLDSATPPQPAPPARPNPEPPSILNFLRDLLSPRARLKDVPVDGSENSVGALPFASQINSTDILGGAIPSRLWASDEPAERPFAVGFKPMASATEFLRFADGAGFPSPATPYDQRNDIDDSERPPDTSRPAVEMIAFRPEQHDNSLSYRRSATPIEKGWRWDLGLEGQEYLISEPMNNRAAPYDKTLSIVDLVFQSEPMGMQSMFEPGEDADIAYARSRRFNPMRWSR